MINLDTLYTFRIDAQAHAQNFPTETHNHDYTQSAKI